MKQKDLHQVGRSFLKKDKQYTALPPGIRVSDAGNVYYERRANRSDKNKKNRL